MNRRGRISRATLVPEWLGCQLHVTDSSPCDNMCKTMLKTVRPQGLLIILVLAACASGWAQEAKSPQDYVPPELQASDPEVKTYLDTADHLAKEGKYTEAFQQVQQALDLCIRKKLPDKGLLEAKLATALFMQGNVDAARQHWLTALKDSGITGNLVLQADTLVALSSLSQATGKADEALDMASKAVALSRKSGNFWIQSRCLGEMGRLQLTLGKQTEARASVEEALRLDRLNQYGWEPTHLLYLAWVTFADPAKLDQGIQLASSARDLAIKREDYVAFMLTSTSLGRAYVQKGQLNEGIALLERSRGGMDDQGRSLFKNPVSYKAGIALPYPQITFLEAIAGAYQAGHRTDDALKSWTELYDVAKRASFTLAAAEAAHSIGDIYQSKKEYSQAIRFYSLAAESWEKGGNAERRIDALGSEAFMLLQNSQSEEALRVYDSLLPLVKEAKDSRRQFVFNLAIVETVQPGGGLERTQKALREAESLLSPDLTLAGVDPNLIMEMYVRLAGVYEKKNEQIPMLIALEKAMTPAEALGKVEAMVQLDREIEKDLAAAHAKEKATSSYEAEDFATALAYFELLQHFEETVARWKGKLDDYNRDADNQPLKKVLEIPLKLIQQADGPVVLETNLRAMGPIAARVRLEVLTLLSDYYLREQHPEKTIEFASVALSYLQLGENEQPRSLDVRVVCRLAYALLMQKDLPNALQRVGTCLSIAKKLGDAQLLGMAHQLNVMVLQAAGRENETQESNEYLRQHAPDDPMHYVELAQLKNQQGNHAGATEALRKALGLIEARKDQKQTAYVHLALADSLRAGTPGSDEERAHLEAALSLYHQLDDVEAQARVSTALGIYFAGKQDSAQAVKYFDTALQLSRQIKNRSDEAYALSAIGDAYRILKKPALALNSYRKAAEIYHGIHETAAEAFQLKGESQALDDLHKSEEALVTALKAKSVADTSGAWPARYWTRHYLSILYSQRGDYQNALTADRQAQSVASAADQPLHAAWAGLLLATDSIIVGEWEEALDVLNHLLPVFHQFHETPSEIQVYSLLVDIYSQRESDLKDFDKALAYYRAALQLVEKTDSSLKPGLSMSLEEGLWQQKRYKESRNLIGESLAYYSKNKNISGQANALLSMAEVQRLEGDVRGAAATLTHAESFVKQTDDLYMTGRLYYSQAALKKKEGRFKEAIAQYERVIGMLEQFKSTADASVRRKTSEGYGYIYDELSDAWYSLGLQDAQQKLRAADKALQYAELNKSRVFTTSWGRTFVDGLKRQLPAPLQEKERNLAVRQGALQAELEQSLSGRGTRPAKQVQEELKREAEEQAALENELRAANPAYAEARYPRPVAISDLPLRRGELFVEFKVLQDSLLVWMIEGTEHGPNLAAFYKVEHPRDWFMENIAALRRPFNRGDPDQFDPRLSEELFRTLFPEPYARKLLTAESIIFAPDDALFLLPFEILSPAAVQSNFVLLKQPVTYVPSAAALRLSRAVNPVKHEWAAQFFGIADPITSEDDERYTAATVAAELERDRPSQESGNPPVVRAPVLRGGLKSREYIFERLPDTAKEINNIAGLFTVEQSTVVRTGLEATKRELLQTDLGRFRFVHFATHGFVPVEPGIREPALILSYDGKEEERMMLTLSEIIQLKLHAEMVVLSACNTGSGKVTRAEGVSSLGTAFLAAGASSVMMSLWKVADQSTAILMQEFYKNLLRGMPKNKALANARATLVSKGYKNPFFWAPFVLTGE